MPPDAAPNDVLFARNDFLTVLKGGAAVFTFPSHLEDIAPLLHRLDAQTAAEGSFSLKIFNEFLDCPFERGSFFGAEPVPVAIKLFRARVGGQSLD